MIAEPFATVQSPPPLVRPKTGRVEVLEQIAERYHDLVERSGRGFVGQGGPPGMPATYTDSVREFERLMGELRGFAPVQWWHVSERYLRSFRSMRTVKWQSGRWILEPHAAVVAQPGGWTLDLAKQRGRKRRAAQEFRVTVVVWSPAVRLEKVRRGMHWMGEHWSLGHEPMVPDELRVVA